jgi:hypothetical protein
MHTTHQPCVQHTNTAISITLLLWPVTAGRLQLPPLLLLHKHKGLGVSLPPLLPSLLFSTACYPSQTAHTHTRQPPTPSHTFQHSTSAAAW